MPYLTAIASWEPQKHINIVITKHRTQCNTPPVGHPCPPVALVKSHPRRVQFYFFFDMMGSQKTIIQSLLKVVARFNPATFFSVNPFSCYHTFLSVRGNQIPQKMPKMTTPNCFQLHCIFSRLKRYDQNRIVLATRIYTIVCK